MEICCCEFIRVHKKPSALSLPHCAHNLRREPITDSLACFEAVAMSHHYSVNLLTGIVLYDGAPPSLLPADMVANPLYKRVFGDTNFEVTCSNGCFRTARAVGGHFYQFCLAGDGESLVIEEIDQQCDERLELLHPEGGWGRSIPVRFRTMNSHWLCRSRSIIVLRGKSFRNHDVNFVVDCNSPDGVASCYRIPPHLRSRDWKELLEDARGEGLRLGIRGKLILPREGCHLLSVFAKFEPRAVGPEALIHLYLQPDGGLEIDLTRFQLVFKVDPPSAQGNGETNGSGVLCLSHRGFELACAQQLGDTLPDLTRYLILCREGEDTRVLVPRGTVEGKSSATPRVQIRCRGEASESAELEVFCYTVHGRWNQLVPGGISARLQLASMYAATSTLLPDVRAGMTGSEKAMALVRRCFVNHPLSHDDQHQLLEVLLGLAGSNPALALLCGDLFESSVRLHFLHSQSTQPVMPPGVAGTLADAATAYRGALPWNIRRRLTASEESRILGGRVPGSRALNPTRDLEECDLQPCPISGKRVQAAEDALLRTRDIFASRSCADGTVAVAPSSEVQSPPYPLQKPRKADALTRDMHGELKLSWGAHQLCPPSPSPKSSTAFHQLHHEFATKYGAVSGMREVVEEFLDDALNGFGGNADEVSTHIQRLVGLRPTSTLEDLPCLCSGGADHAEGIYTFNPFLSKVAWASVSEAAVSWLRLCVLEDKLERLKGWSISSTSQALLWQELQVRK